MTDPFTPEVRGTALRLVRQASEQPGRPTPVPAALLPEVAAYLAGLVVSLLDEMSTGTQPRDVLLDRLVCFDMEEAR